MAHLWPDMIIVSLALYILIFSFWNILALTLVFFMLCLIAHGELYHIRPTVQHLTQFYLKIALGGFVGGAAVTLFEPICFNELFEFPVAIVGLAIALWWSRGLPKMRWWKDVSILKGGPRLVLIVIMNHFVFFLLSQILQENRCLIILFAKQV